MDTLQDSSFDNDITTSFANEGSNTFEKDNSYDISNNSTDEALKTTESDQFSPYYREYRIIIEYKHLPSTLPSGIYVLPSLESTFIWNCVIFIRQGIYKEGVFKFNLLIPADYPERAPFVQFYSRVYHPLVDHQTGELDLQRVFPNWDTQNNCLWHALAYVKKIFYKIDVRNPLNTEAAELYLQPNKTEFLAKVKDCVEESIQNCYVNEENSTVRFASYTDEHEQVRLAILNRKLDQGGENSLLSWVSTGMSKIFSIKY